MITAFVVWVLVRGNAELDGFTFLCLMFITGFLDVCLLKTLRVIFA